MVKIFLCILIVHASPAAFAQKADLVGVASVIDGDTIEIHGDRVRLEGIDAPESSQLCAQNGKTWRCGQKASLALSDFIGRQTVTCKGVGKDKYGRFLGRCSVGNVELNAWMVSNGFALAYRKYSVEYIELEKEAEGAEKGIWTSDFLEPWNWRRAQRGKGRE